MAAKLQQLEARQPMTALGFSDGGHRPPLSLGGDTMEGDTARDLTHTHCTGLLAISRNKEAAKQ